MEFNSTSLPQNYSKYLFEKKSFDLADVHAYRIADILFTATSNVLNAAKSKDHPTALEFREVGGVFIAAAICQYFPNEDANKPGNWSLVWTFNESDIPENTNRIANTDTNVHPYFRAVAGDKHTIRFRDPSAVVVLFTAFLEELRNWLDQNAKENEIVTIELESVFQARVAVENGEKVFALEPLGEIKALVKDDASIEK